MSFLQPRWLRVLPRGFVVNVATLGPLGARMPAPGTWGSAAGLLYAVMFFRSARWEVTFAWSVVAAAVAAVICGEAEKRLGQSDPGSIVLDEFVVMPLVFLGWRSGVGSVAPEWAVLLLGFALFRLFDIWKPFGISRLQRWPGGWGVIADDFAAALVACGVLHLGAWIWRL